MQSLTLPLGVSASFKPATLAKILYGKGLLELAAQAKNPEAPSPEKPSDPNDGPWLIEKPSKTDPGG